MGEATGDRATQWTFAQAVKRVERLEGLLADYATNVCGLPLRRSETHGARSGVTWSIDGEPVVELVVEPDGPDRVLVHELALLRPVRKALRSRHLEIEYGSDPHP